VAAVGVTLPAMLFVTVTVQMSTPPPPFAEPSHCVIWVMGWAEVDVVVAQVPAPAPTGPAAPEHTVTVIVERPVGAPVLEMLLTTVTVQESP
jgi:hypothetical protein